MKTVQQIHGDGVTPVTAYFTNSSCVPCVYAVREKSLKTSVTNVTRHPIEVITEKGLCLEIIGSGIGRQIFHDGMTAMTTYLQNLSRVPRAYAVRTEFFRFLLSCRHAVIPLRLKANDKP